MCHLGIVSEETFQVMTQWPVKHQQVCACPSAKPEDLQQGSRQSGLRQGICSEGTSGFCKCQEDREESLLAQSPSTPKVMHPPSLEQQLSNVCSRNT